MLDPQLLVAYEYGANFLAPKPPNGAGMPDRAIALEEFGILNNPDAWQLYYNAGFISELSLPTEFYQTQLLPRGLQSVAVGGPGEKINNLLARAYLAAGVASQRRMRRAGTQAGSRSCAGLGHSAQW